MLGDYAKIWHYGICWWMQGYSNQLYTGICNREIPLNFNEGCIPKFLRLLKNSSQLSDGNLKAPLHKSTSYLLCYHEVIAEWLTGANGSQQKNEDHVQKPPTNNKNKPISSQQDKREWRTVPLGEPGDSQAPTTGSSITLHGSCSFRDKFDTNPFYLPTTMCQGQLQHGCRHPWGEATCTPQVCRGNIPVLGTDFLVGPVAKDQGVMV